MIGNEELVDVPCGFNPDETDLKEVFDDGIARAIWIAYRRNHIMCKDDLECLRDGSLEISKRIREEPDFLEKPVEELAFLISQSILWTTPARFAFMNNEEHYSFTEFLLPYLRGEKIATIKLMDGVG